jgi:protein ATS1
MRLYGLGSNGSGQLGLGHLEDVSVPTSHQSWASAAHALAEPTAIRAGGNHTLILTADQCLYLSGAPTESEHQPLPDFSEDPHSQSRLVAKNVRLCSATWEASIFVQDNNVYSYGKGDRGELGRDDAAGPLVEISLLTTSTSISVSTSASTATTISSIPPRIVDLASGVQHTVVVFDDGQVWGWGNGRKGQLGEGQGYVHRPRKVQGLDFKVVRAVCGREFTFLVGDPADGRCSVLGSDKWAIVSHAPSSVPGWRDLGASWGSVAVLLDSGEIVSWGRNDHGQLAPKNLPHISKLACGSEHSLALTKDDKVLAWGWGEHGNCGPDVDEAHDVKNGWTELKMPNSEEQHLVKGIGAGCATSWIWTSPKEG